MPQSCTVCGTENPSFSSNRNLDVDYCRGCQQIRPFGAVAVAGAAAPHPAPSVDATGAANASNDLAHLLTHATAEVTRGLPVPDKAAAAVMRDPTSGPAAADAAVATHCRCVGELSLAVRSGAVRDHDFSPEVHAAAFGLLHAGWASKSLVLRHRVLYLFTKLMLCPEWDVGADGPGRPDAKTIHALFEQLGGRSPGGAEHPLLHQILFWLYSRFPSARPLVRGLLGKTLREFALVGHDDTAVSVMLDVLTHVIDGFNRPLTAIHHTLFREVLLPLHQPNVRRAGGAAVVPAGMPGSAAADGQTMLAQYHAQLVRCELLFDKLSPGLATEAVGYVLRHWPEQKAGVSSKEVLLLHEIDTLLEHVDAEAFARVAPALLPRLVKCIAGAFAQLAQRTLQMWKKEHFAALVALHSDTMLGPLISACYRGGKPHWNATVNRLSVSVLDDLRARVPERFETVCNARITVAPAAAAVSVAHEAFAGIAPTRRKPAAPKSYKKTALGGTGIPTEAKLVPPLTGFAPTAAPWSKPKLSRSQWSGGANQPPATVTGVAPWAQPPRGGRPPSGRMPKRLAVHGVGSGSARYGDPVALPEDTEVIGEDDEFDTSHGMMLCEEDDPAAGAADETADCDAVDATPGGAVTSASAAKRDTALPLKGAEVVLRFMEDHRGEAKVAAAAADADAMKLTPTYLPDLKFHKLVFGHNLGSGAFSTVRHARHVEPGKPGSEWAQYAVKLIAISKIQEHGYEASVSREIAVLRVMSHPGIARMVAHFRWRDGAYLVLEYAAKGDLHSYIIANGSLDLLSARFIAGEILAALAYVHSAGFAFADLKSENVVLMESGHAKLTDFGGARAVSPAAREVVQKGRLALRKLRNGDSEWRIQKAAAESADGEAAASPAADEPSGEHGLDEPLDDRIEGTAAFLAPEIARGGTPSFAGDSWSFGCLIYQMLAGRPPVWAETIAEAVAAIVRFEASDEKFPATFPAVAKSLVSKLLEPSLSQRASLDAAAADDFFDGLDVHALYTMEAPELAAGAVAPAPDAKWARRQNSMLWQPMPAAISTAPTLQADVPGLSFEAISETVLEARAPFVASVSAVAERL